MLGKPLELLVEDDRGEAAEAASAVSKLITRDHVVALIGENASSRTLAAAPIAQSYRVPMISPTSTNVEVTKKGDYIFRACFIDSYQGQALATFARRNLKAQTAAILVDSRSDYSVGLAEAFREDFAAAGGRIVERAEVHRGRQRLLGAADGAAAASTRTSSFVPGYYTDAGLIARQAQVPRASRPSLLGADGWDSPKLAEIGGAAIEGAYFCQPLLRRRPVARRARVRRRTTRRATAPSRTRSPRSPTTPTRMLADAIRGPGSTEGKRVRDALASTRGLRRRHRNDHDGRGPQSRSSRP